MKKSLKFTAAAAMIGLMAFAAAGCGGGDKKAATAWANAWLNSTRK